MNYIVPALLFSGISMFFNGYTIRYIKLSKLIRNLHKIPEKNYNIVTQIEQFRKRLKYVKWIQFFSVLSLIFATLSIFFGFLEFNFLYYSFFIFSFINFLISLIISILEIKISTKALDISLNHGGHNLWN